LAERAPADNALAESRQAALLRALRGSGEVDRLWTRSGPPAGGSGRVGGQASTTGDRPISAS
jgi:hypothetical protein